MPVPVPLAVLRIPSPSPGPTETVTPGPRRGGPGPVLVLPGPRPGLGTPGGPSQLRLAVLATVLLPVLVLVGTVLRLSTRSTLAAAAGRSAAAGGAAVRVTIVAAAGSLNKGPGTGIQWPLAARRLPVLAATARQGLVLRAMLWCHSSAGTVTGTQALRLLPPLLPVPVQMPGPAQARIPTIALRSPRSDSVINHVIDYISPLLLPSVPTLAPTAAAIFFGSRCSGCLRLISPPYVLKLSQPYSEAHWLYCITRQLVCASGCTAVTVAGPSSKALKCQCVQVKLQ